MSTYVDSRVGTRKGRSFPAYGPIDSILGFVVFYIFVERATPTIVAVFSTAIPGLSASAIGFGIAALLWFIFVVTILDQLRRQLAALGVGSRGDVERSTREGGTPSGTLVLLYVGAVVLGGAIAAWSFERAVDAGIMMIQIVGTLDITRFDLLAFVVMIVFFVSFGAATRALDRLVIGGFRAVLTS
ncbi:MULTISPECIES: hypothetical protein [Haloferax]|uniref:Uncharacterized protein n=2 Tax=Haloferax TaxID=2251 RepID=A0A6G1Z6H5_9EURY|nr:MULTISPECIES: hypothetical protein [Haloferax]KAB1185377.1 hypothetical protein Hfx1149_15075 [Haloferax sp. CBA1149]MRW82018.1 hypothetical protein [Haloferax marinisediminis]